MLNKLVPLVFRNNELCKIRPKILPIMHFSQESYKFVQESQFLQICYNVEHFLKEFENISTTFAFICKKFKKN